MPATYDKFATQYDAVMRPLERWFIDEMRGRVFAELPQNAKMLEVGAGTGANFAFYPTGTTGVASEPSGEMLRVAQTKERPHEVVLVQTSAESLPFGDNVFDAAFATLVFCSIPAPPRAFAELKRVVRVGGPIVLLEHVRPANLLGPLFDVLNLFTSWLFEDHCNRRTAQLAKTAGLDVVRVEKRLWGIVNLIVCRA